MKSPRKLKIHPGVCPKCAQPFLGKKDQKYCSRSCGSKGHTRRQTHNLSLTREYRTWANMKSRCLNPEDQAFHHYGARGITICERWMEFEPFLQDMGWRPSKEHSLDRINNDLGYSPENCRWTTRTEQARNRRGTWSKEDDQKIRDGVANGKNFIQIAAEIGKKHPSVTARAYRIGLRSGQPCNNFRRSTEQSLHHRECDF